MPNDPLMHAGHYLQSLLAYWWPFCRIMAVFSLAPMFSHKAISVRVRILLALALTLVLGAALPTPPNLDPLSLAGMLAAITTIGGIKLNALGESIRGSFQKLQVTGQ